MDVVTPGDFGRTTLPYCSFVVPGESRRRVGVGVDTDVLDLTTAAATVVPEHADLFADGSLDALLAAGPETWHAIRSALLAWVDDAHTGVVQHHVSPADQVELVLPFTVADYVDFYASEQHATNLGRMFRPDGEALMPNWKHLPIGYHGRSGTIVVSGTPIHRPSGQRRTGQGEIVFGPSVRLDIEAEVGFVVGGASTLGEPVPLADAGTHLFGICLVNDWSARDIQAWEYQPLGPFLGKSFATSVSSWVVPMAALDAVRTHPPDRDVPLLPYLDDDGLEPWGLDLRLEVRLNGEVVSRPPFAGMYWTGAQMLAHMTVNGATVRPGDLFASGTVSGSERDERGSFIELSWNGAEPLTLADGSTHSFLENGDTVAISATAGDLWLGEVSGTIVL
ncbi:fumarylacetoacetase [Aeromicrobium terrae]|uniref:fumarylacetoacetase n=1 Tax=Aeromicrobium terrae TaxID=2498846 RepID=A0A5C8NC67_9ACTN|nr:fumarylacetoacetase [Aeromicrobium terrae]TXL56649.1 fumarylacetoacetase [Aeromicrobium terrae]